MRWWLRRRGRAWRICDWERIDTGYSEAARRALDEALLERNEQSAYRQALSALKGAITNQRSSNMPLAAQQLISAQELKLPALAHDFINLELAFVWHDCSRPDQVVAAADRVSDPAANPGVYYLRALAHSEREQFACNTGKRSVDREQQKRGNEAPDEKSIDDVSAVE